MATKQELQDVMLDYYTAREKAKADARAAVRQQKEAERAVQREEARRVREEKAAQRRASAANLKSVKEDEKISAQNFTDYQKGYIASNKEEDRESAANLKEVKTVAGGLSKAGKTLVEVPLTIGRTLVSGVGGLKGILPSRAKGLKAVFTGDIVHRPELYYGSNGGALRNKVWPHVDSSNPMTFYGLAPTDNLKTPRDFGDAVYKALQSGADEDTLEVSTGLTLRQINTGVRYIKANPLRYRDGGPA